MANTSANSGRLLSKLRSYPYWIQFALVAATYYLSRSLFMFQIKHGSFAGAFIYAPIGLGLAALLILGYRIWPAIAVGAFFVHLEGMNRLPFALSSMTSNTLEALLSAYLLQRFTAFDLRLQRRKDVLGFVGLSVVLATAICATIGAVLYCLAGVVPWRRFENFWFLWWRADAMGTLIVAPLILVWSTRQPRTELRRYGEAGILAVTTLLTSYFVFVGWTGSQETDETLSYLLFPILFWAAIRLGQRGTVTVLAAVLLFAAYGTLSGKGPFTTSDMTLSMVQLFVFVGISSVSAMLLAASISEHKDSEEKFARAFRRSPVLAAITTLDEGRIVDANDSFLDFYGAERSEIVGRAIGDLNIWATPDDRSGLLAQLREHGRASDVEAKLRRRSGELRDTVISADTIQIGGQTCVLSSAYDITERKQAEDELRISEERFRTLAEDLHVCVVVHGPDGTIRFGNRATRDAFGFNEPQFVGKDSSDLGMIAVREDGTEIPYQMRPVPQALTTRQPVLNQIMGWLRPGSTDVLWIFGSAVPQFTKDGAISHVISAFTDITELRRTQESLRQAEARYRDLVENAHDIIFTTDPTGKITSLNQIGIELSGYSADEILFMNMDQFLSPESRKTSKTMLDRVVRSGATPIYELELRTKDDRRLTMELRSRAIYQNGIAVGVEGIARDVTERKQLEAQFRQAQKMEAVGRLAAGVAHDFNNLLTIIRGNCEMRLLDLAPEDPVRESLESVLVAARRASSLTRQLLAFSRQQVIQPRILNLNSVLAELQRMLGQLMGEQISLEFIPGDNLSNVRVDPGLVQQAVMNLIVNAQDAMPRGGKLTIETSCMARDESYIGTNPPSVRGRYVMIAVADTGVGMDEATQARIFEPFFTTKEVGKGTGLGLATVFGIVKQSEGFITVSSKPGVGSTFNLYFPAVDGPTEAPAAFPSSKELLRGSETILVIENETKLRNLIRDYLSSLGYSVFTAPDRDDALEIGEECPCPPHLVITDAVMPGLAGRMTERFLSANPSVRVLYMSGYTGDAISSPTRTHGGTSYLQKPFGLPALAKNVREILDRKNSPKNAVL